MRFIHTADIHIGAAPEKDIPALSNRSREIYDTFSGIIDICEKEEPDILLIAGDIFHKQPLVRELKEINYLFTKLKKTKVVLIAGNHDYISARSNYRDFVWNENVTMLKEETLQSVYFEDLNTQVYGFSYHTRDIIDARLKGIEPEDQSRINILLAHGGEDRSLPFDRKKLQNAGFDYVALGHLHKPEMISDRIAYPGSPEPLDKNELGEHGFIRGEISKEGVHIDQCPIAQRRYFREEYLVTPEMTDRSVMESLRSIIQEKGIDNIYHFILKGKRDKDIHLDIKSYESLGIITRISDETVPDYDFDALMNANSDNIIGMYIKRIREKTDNDETAVKALYYGLEALLTQTPGREDR